MKFIAIEDLLSYLLQTTFHFIGNRDHRVNSNEMIIIKFPLTATLRKY